MYVYVRHRTKEGWVEIQWILCESWLLHQSCFFFAPVLWYFSLAGRQIGGVLDGGGGSAWAASPFFGTRVALVSATTSKNRKAIPVDATISINRKVVRTCYIIAGCNMAGSFFLSLLVLTIFRADKKNMTHNLTISGYNRSCMPTNFQWTTIIRGFEVL